jgi:hypothetical protein
LGRDRHASVGNAKVSLIALGRFSSLLQILLQFCSIIFHIIRSLLAVESKEVTVQHNTDALQQDRVNTFATEDIIHVGAVTVQPLCQPCHAAPLAAQLSLYFSSYMYSHNSTVIIPTGSPMALTQKARKAF